MNESDSNLRPDLVELLAGSALGDLDADEWRLLAEQSTAEDEQDAQELRLAASALQLAFAGQAENSIPSALREKIAADAPRHLLNRESLAATASVAQATSVASVPRVSRREQLAWLVTAASILFAVSLWVSNKQSSVSTIVAMTPAQAREVLLAEAEDRIEVAWSVGTTPFETKVSGDVVWSNRLQKGFMRFVGMPLNDKSVQQYQLWIIDPVRDEEPIDGGVFDITSKGEVIIPIDAKLTVVDPAAFAVTIEKPGGVVVSDQKRLPLLAKVPESKG